MHLQKMVDQLAQKPDTTVPEWMMGCFKRRSIAFANGLTDTDTHVFWLQSRNITIDLRLPIAEEQVPAKPLLEYDAAELYALANYEGWYAESTWQDGLLSWSGGTAFQLHNRWPEPAELKRVGDCMIEFAPSGAYVEDWRLMSRTPGPLIGLRLITEENLESGEITHRGGAMIINGNWAGLVLGRNEALVVDEPQTQLRDWVMDRELDAAALAQVFNFETSVAHGDLAQGFDVAYSTIPERVGQPLCSMEGFELDSDNGEVIQFFVVQGTPFKRRFQIDTLESEFPYSGDTGFTRDAGDWFGLEQETLGRYLRKLT